MTDYWKDNPEISARLERVAQLMEKTLRSRDFPLADPIADIIHSQGKMLRPALLIIGSRFGRALPDERILPLAAAIELLHIATLIHDDILDEAELRRGLPTLHTRFGVKEALLAGDWLFATCFRLAAESARPNNARLLSHLVATICSAEISQDLGKFHFDASPRRYFRTIAGKTALLFSLALDAGATEAKTPARTLQTLRRAGYDIGMAFQVIDDILDYESNEGVLRKSVGKDLKEGLCTLPLIYAIQADPAGMKGLLSPFDAGRRSIDEASLASILGRTMELGGMDRARSAARRFTGRAETEIERLPACAAREELSALAKKLLVRDY